MKNFRLMIAVVAPIFIFGCATTASDNKPNRYAQYIQEQKLEPVSSVTAFKYHGWNSLDKEHLIVSTTFKKSYLLALYGPCNDLNFTNRIAIHTQGMTLQAKFDSIYIPNSPEYKCSIKSIYPLNEEQVKQLRELRVEKESPSA